MKEVLKSCTKLEIFNIGSNNIGSKGCEYIAEALKFWHVISELDLSRNNIGSEGSIYIGVALKSCN